MAQSRGAGQSLNSTNLADLLERVLDKGVVIAGDIKIKLVDIELLTIQIRLVICSVDKAREMGMDWWANQPIIKPLNLAGTADNPDGREREIVELKAKLAALEARLDPALAAAPLPPPPPQRGTFWQPPTPTLRGPDATGTPTPSPGAI